jgi:hypothetical protein
MEIHINMDSDINIGVASGNSFKKDSSTKMKYTDFLSKMTEDSLGVAMKDSSVVYEALKKDI